MVAEKFKGQNLTDPFMGGEVELRQVAGNLHWMGVGKGWHTKLFDSRQELVHFLSTREGKAPPFAARPAISVRERTPEEDRLTDAEQAIKDRREMNEMVQESLSRSVHKPAVGVRAR